MNRNSISKAMFATAALAVATLNTAQAQTSLTPCSLLASGPLVAILRPQFPELIPACPTLVGTWQATISPDGMPPFTAYNVFYADGNSVEFDNSNPPGQQTVAVGPWQRTGDKQYAMLEINQLFDNQGNFAGTLRVTATITLDSTGNKFTSKFDLKVLDPDSNVVFQGSGTAAATRVSLN